MSDQEKFAMHDELVAALTLAIQEIEFQRIARQITAESLILNDLQKTLAKMKPSLKNTSLK